MIELERKLQFFPDNLLQLQVPLELLIEHLVVSQASIHDLLVDLQVIGVGPDLEIGD